MLKRLALLVLMLGALAISAEARGVVTGWCESGNKTVTVPGATGPSTTKFQQSFPGCTITVYLAGTVTAANIYSDNSGTVKANPFTAATSGLYFFYADNGQYDLQLSGGGIPSPFSLGSLTAFDPTRSTGAVRDCSSPAFGTGSDMGARLTACIGDLPATGGTADARGFQGAQILTSAVAIGSSTKPVTVLLGASTISMSAALTVQSGSSIVGLPCAGQGVGSGNTANCGTRLVQASGANLSCLITMAGTNGMLQSFSLSGDASNNATANDGICVTGLHNGIDQVTSQNNKRDGIRITSTTNGNEAAAALITRSTFLNNGRNGITCEYTTDIAIGSNSTFQGNGGSGADFNNCSSSQIVGSQFMGNTLYGFKAYGTATSWGGGSITFTSNQLGGNSGGDLAVLGWDSSAAAHSSTNNVISENTFTPTAPIASNSVDAITITDSSWNVVDGNKIKGANAAGTSYRYGIHIVDSTGSREFDEIVTGNSLSGSFGTAAYLAPADVMNPAPMPNATALRAYDTTGSPTNILELGSDNQTYLFGRLTTNTINFQATPGTTGVQLTSAGTFFNPGGLTEIDTSGNLTTPGLGQFSYVKLTNAAAPGTPVLGLTSIYAKADTTDPVGSKKLYYKDSGGNEYTVCNTSICTGGGGGSVTGSGTANTIPVWTASTVLGDSPLTIDGGSNVYASKAIRLGLFTNSSNESFLTSQAQGQFGPWSTPSIADYTCGVNIGGSGFNSDSTCIDNQGFEGNFFRMKSHLDYFDWTNWGTSTTALAYHTLQLRDSSNNVVFNYNLTGAAIVGSLAPSTGVSTFAGTLTGDTAVNVSSSGTYQVNAQPIFRYNSSHVQYSDNAGVNWTDISGATAGVASVGQASTNSITIAGTGSGPWTGAVTIDTIQGIKTTSTPQFAQLGIGNAASGTAGTILTASTIESQSTGTTAAFQIGNGTNGQWLGNGTLGTNIVNAATTLNLAGNAAFRYSGGNVQVSNDNGSTWNNVGTSTGITSAQGTANQVLVNGTSGSGQTGAVTLTTPQSIGTSSTPQFAQLGIGNASSGTGGTILAASTIESQSTGGTAAFQIGNGANGTWTGAGTLGTNIVNAATGFEVAGAATSNHALVGNGTNYVDAAIVNSIVAGSGISISGATGNVTITATGGGGGVTSITGTANQVIASASTGAVTLSTPQDIATGSTVRFGGVLVNQANDGSGKLLQVNGGIESVGAGNAIVSYGTADTAIQSINGGVTALNNITTTAGSFTTAGTSGVGYYVNNGGTQIITGTGNLHVNAAEFIGAATSSSAGVVIGSSFSGSPNISLNTSNGNIGTQGIVNSITGYQYNSAAPSGHALVGNGTNYVDGVVITKLFTASTYGPISTLNTNLYFGISTSEHKINANTLVAGSRIRVRAAGNATFATSSNVSVGITLSDVENTFSGVTYSFNLGGAVSTAGTNFPGYYDITGDLYVITAGVSGTCSTAGSGIFSVLTGSNNATVEIQNAQATIDTTKAYYVNVTVYISGITGTNNVYLTYLSTEVF